MLVNISNLSSSLVLFYYHAVDQKIFGVSLSMGFDIFGDLEIYRDLAEAKRQWRQPRSKYANKNPS